MVGPKERVGVMAQVFEIFVVEGALRTEAALSPEGADALADQLGGAWVFHWGWRKHYTDPLNWYVKPYLIERYHVG